MQNKQKACRIQANNQKNAIYSTLQVGNQAEEFNIQESKQATRIFHTLYKIKIFKLVTVIREPLGGGGGHGHY
jgi:hypothetical protein